MAAEQVSIFFTNHSFVTAFRFAYNEIAEPIGISLVENIMKPNQIVVLDLSFTNLSKQATQFLFESLSSNSSLLELNVSGNHCGKNGLAALATALQKNTTLQKLGLRHCGFGKVFQVFYLGTDCR